MKNLHIILKNLGLTLRTTIDLTESTDDPGNTRLTLYFLTLNDETLDLLDNAQYHGRILNELEPILAPDLGDHSQELSLIYQNSEIILILNECK